MLFSHVANVAQLPLQIPLGWVMVPTWLRHSLRKGGTFAFAPSGDFGSLACRLVWNFTNLTLVAEPLSVAWWSPTASWLQSSTLGSDGRALLP